MKLFSSAIAALTLLFAFALPSMANAVETADVDVAITPRAGNAFYNNAFKAANWKVDTAIIATPGAPTITPMKVADLGFPPSSLMTFNPKASMPVCPASEIGPPPINMSVSVDIVVARCPNSILGNGTATFGLAQSTNPILARAGEIVVFNGGRVGGLPKIKIYAYSYETLAGIYTEATLQPDGQLRFEIPPLTSDSSVTELNLSIPSKQIVIEKPNLAKTVTLPGGQDLSYVQAKCVGTGGFPWTADLTMGSRDELTGDPIGPPEFQISDSGTAPCTGVTAAPKRARIGLVRIIGPGSARLRRPTVFRVVVKNTGNATATGVRAVLYGRGFRANVPVGRIAARRSRTVRAVVRFRSRGRIRMTAKVASRNAGSRVARKVVRVR